MAGGGSNGGVVKEIASAWRRDGGRENAGMTKDGSRTFAGAAPVCHYYLVTVIPDIVI